MNLTLNDFRAVLGKKNDGNVIMTEDENHAPGIKKVNYGFFKKEVTPDDAAKNREVRQAFFNAISNSPEGRRAGADFINQISARLGIPDGQVSSQPLNRREVKLVLDALDMSHYGEIGLINDEMAALKKAGVLNDKIGYDIRALLMPTHEDAMSYFINAELMMKAFGKKEGICGFNHEQLKRFVNENADRIKLMAFDRLYWDQLESQRLGIPGPLAMVNKPNIQKLLLVDVIQSIMRSYARHEEIETHGRTFITGAAMPNKQIAPVDTMKPSVEKVNALLDMVLPNESDSILDNLQNRSLRDMAKRVFSNICYQVAGHQNAPDQVDRQKNAMKEIRDNYPTIAKMLDIPLDVFAGLRPDELKSLAGKMREDVMAALKNAPKEHDGEAVPKEFIVGGAPEEKKVDVRRGMIERDPDPEDVRPAPKKVVAKPQPIVDQAQNGQVSSKQVLGAVADAFAKLLRRTASPEKILLSFVAKTNEDENFNLSSEKQGEIAKNMANALAGDQNLGELQKLAFSNVIRGRNINDGLGDLLASTALADTVKAEMIRTETGPAIRQAAFQELGYTGKTVCYLNRKQLRTKIGGDDRNPIEKPLNDRAATIAGKIAFLIRIMPMGCQNPELMPLVKTDLGPMFVFHGDMKDFDDPSKWPEQDKKTLKEIDKLCDRYSIADVNDTVTYFKTGVDAGDGRGELYRLGRDKYFKMETADAKGSSVIDTVRALDVGFVLSQAGNAKFTMLQGDIRTLYDTIMALVNPQLEDGSEKMPAYDDATGMKELNTYCKVIGNDASQFSEMKGLSMTEFLNLIGSAGLTIKDLGTHDGFAKFILLSRAIKDANNNPYGAIEWFARTTGYDFASMKLADVPLAMAKLIELEKAGLKDPINAYTDAQRNVVNFFEGKIKTEEFNADQKTMRDLMNALHASKGRSANGTCTVGGLTVKFSAGYRGRVKIEVTGADGKAYPIPSNRSADEIIALLETKIANHLNDYGDLAKEILPSVVNGVPEGMTVSRARELSTKVLIAKLGVPSVAFAAMDITTLVRAAKDAIAGTYTKANVPTVPSTDYNAADIVAIQKAYVAATDKERALVKLPADLDMRTYKERTENAPSEKVVHTCISELVMNLDTSAYDRDMAKGVAPGMRLKNVLTAYKPELDFILGDIAGYTKTLPSEVRGGVAAILQSIRNSDREDLATLRKIEGEIAKFIDDTMNVMQAKITALFDGQVNGPQANSATWTKSLAELTNVNGLDPNSPNGKFVLDVLKNYFSKAAPTEKRAMLSAYLRNTFATVDNNGQPLDPSIGKQAGELMKGAGPIFQKMLQGLPIESFSPETQAALKDMKSRLAPIPEPIIRAQLLDLIRSSNGEVLSIEVKQSIGCATVGQALLCHIKTKSHPFTGEDVVIKLRRPNVQTAALREHDVIREIAKLSSPGMEVTFEGQFNTILKELDFTLEAENIDLALVQYDRVNGETIRSMGRLTEAPATMGALILNKVPGNTLDGDMTDVETEIKSIKKQFEKKVAIAPGSNEFHTIFQGNTIADVPIVRDRLSHHYDKLVAEREKLQKLVTVWTNEAIFGSGFFHGDMHAGNIMVSEKEMTFIDFGNVTRLSPDDQKWISKLFLVAGYSFNNSEPGKEFVEALGNLLDAPGKAVLANESKALQDDINAIMRLGQYDKLASKVFAALAAVQRHKIALPESIGAFVQSISRLKGAMSQIDGLIEDCELSMQRIENGPKIVSDLHLEVFADKIPFIKEVIEFVNKGGSNLERVENERERSEDRMSQFDRDISSFYDRISPFSDMCSTSDPEKINTFDFAGVKNTEIFGKTGFDPTLFRDLAKVFKGIKFLEYAGGPISEYNRVKMIEEASDALELLAKNPQSKENDEEIIRQKRILRGATVDIIRNLYNQYAFKLPRHKKFDSFEAIVGSCFANHQAEVEKRFSLMVLESFAYGTLMIDPKIMVQREKASLAAHEANAKLSNEDQVSYLRMLQLDDIASSFRFPGGTAGTADITADNLKEILEVNVKMVRERLGYAEGEKIKTGELSYLATFLKTIRQVKDERNMLGRGIDMLKALNEMRKHAGEANFDIIGVYPVKTDDAIPMTRAIKSLGPGEIDGLGLGDEAKELAKLIAA